MSYSIPGQIASYFLKYFAAGWINILVHLRQYMPDISNPNQYFNYKYKVNNYKMNRSKQIISSPRNKSPPKKSIRSQGFRRKFEGGMPRINHKKVEFHNLYDIDVKNTTIDKQKGLKFWGCVVPQKKKFRITLKSNSGQKRQIPTRGQTIFKNYMRRRPSLALTPRSYQFNTQQKDKKYQTLNNFMPQRVNLYRTNPQFNFEQKQLNNDKTFILTTQDISTINKKNLYQMTPQELEISIQWKKKFLQLFEKKMKQAQSFQFHFRPYRI